MAEETTVKATKEQMATLRKKQEMDALRGIAASTLLKDEVFKKAAEGAGVKLTRRQMNKFIRGEGVVFQFLKKMQSESAGV